MNNNSLNEGDKNNNSIDIINRNIQTLSDSSTTKIDSIQAISNEASNTINENNTNNQNQQIQNSNSTNQIIDNNIQSTVKSSTQASDNIQDHFNNNLNINNSVNPINSSNSLNNNSSLNKKIPPKNIIKLILSALNIVTIVPLIFSFTVIWLIFGGLGDKNIYYKILVDVVFM